MQRALRFVEGAVSVSVLVVVMLVFGKQVDIIRW